MATSQPTREERPSVERALEQIEGIEVEAEGDGCCDMGQNDTIGKIELIPAFVLSTDNTNC